MPIIELTFNEINTSAQVGDTAWAIDTSVGNSIDNVVLIGNITLVNGSTIKVDSATLTSNDLNGYFAMFSKNNKANLGDLKGYYAEVKLVNESTEKSELFSLASEITQSSK